MKKKMPDVGNSFPFQEDNDAPIIKCTEVDGFSRPLKPSSMQRINSFRSELTAPIHQLNGPNCILDGRDTFFERTVF